jgi:hypothetical protein
VRWAEEKRKRLVIKFLVVWQCDEKNISSSSYFGNVQNLLISFAFEMRELRKDLYANDSPVS